MVIKDILKELKTAQKPVVKIFYKGANSKILCIGFNKGMRLDKHKTSMPAILLVLSGKVKFIIEGIETVMNQYDELNIPVDIMHEVFAMEDSLCLLTQG